MRFVAFLALGLLSTVTALAQDFPGIRTSNYAGVSSVFANPANIADSRHRWDFSLFNISTVVGNNKASFNLKDIGRTLNADSIKNNVFAEGTGNSNGAISAVVQGPSVFFNLNKKSALGITTRARVMSNIVDIDSKLAKQLIDDTENDTGFPYTITSANKMVVNANAWTEFGLSYAREIYSSGNHYLKGGISLKYLAGAANTSIHIDNLRATLNEDLIGDDVYLANSSGNIGLNYGGVSTSNFEAKDLLSFESTGFGADLGFVYEYRPDVSLAERRDLNKYKFKVSLAVLDIGSIKYQRDLSRSGGYGINISGAERFYLSALADAEIDDYKDTLNKYPQYFTPNASMSQSKYTVALPSTLQLNVDYHFHKGLYVNLDTQLALTNSSKNVNNSQYYTSVALTPRFESKGVGVFLPMTYNSLTAFTAGAAFRLGPLFIGSGSILSAAIGSSKQADFIFGLHFGSLQKSN
ncbi:MAG TPA: DUF5723 family protein [Flavisolibacter sp.]|nr:DUF5723 family protein [Flavisolibacter sp.]